MKWLKNNRRTKTKFGLKKKKKIKKKKANQRENRKTKSSTQQRERKHGILAKIVIVKRTGAPQKGGAKNNEIQRINFNC